MRQAHDLGVHDRPIDEEKMWPSLSLFLRQQVNSRQVSTLSLDEDSDNIWQLR